MTNTTSDILRHLLASLILLSPVLAQVPRPQRSPNFSAWDMALHEVITNKGASDELLLQSISRLGRVTEPASFWTRIANDTNYPVSHRTRAVFALLRRHGESTGDLASLGRAIAPAHWLAESTVDRITHVFGRMAIDVNPGSSESVFTIRVLNGPNAYIKLQGDVDLDTVSKLIRGEPASNVGSPTIMQIGYGDDYDEWLRRPIFDRKSKP